MRFWIEKFNCRLLFEKVVVHCLHHRNFFVPGPIKYYFENVKVLSLSEPGSEVDCRLNRYCCESRGLEKETFFGRHLPPSSILVYILVSNWFWFRESVFSIFATFGPFFDKINFTKIVFFQKKKKTWLESQNPNLVNLCITNWSTKWRTFQTYIIYYGLQCLYLVFCSLFSKK